MVLRKASGVLQGDSTTRVCTGEDAEFKSFMVGTEMGRECDEAFSLLFFLG